MKQSLTKSQITMAVVLAVLIVSAGWSFYWMTSAELSAQNSAENLQICKRLADQIKKMHTQPLRAALETRTSTELAGQIETSAKTANLRQNCILQIDPQTARRLGNTAYKEQPTMVELRDVTLKQLVVFLNALTDDQSGMDVAELRLESSRDDSANAQQTEETWLAEVTLSHLIFAP
jgi:hypothetical protein